MRVIRAVFLLILAVLLVAVMLANRQPVTLSLKLGSVLPEASITLPLFLVILVTLMLGLAVGLIWEWLRSAGHRSQSAHLGREVARLEREVAGLRRSHAAPADEVLAILDAPRPAKTPSTDNVALAGPAVPAKG